LYDQLFDFKMMQLLQSKMNTEELTGDFNQFVAFLTGKEEKGEKEKGKKEKGEGAKARMHEGAKGEGANEEEKPKKTRRSPAKKNGVVKQDGIAGQARNDASSSHDGSSSE